MIRRALLNLGMTTLALVSLAVTALLIGGLFLWIVYNTEPPQPTCGIAATSPDC
jgi:hypothetical protein